MRFQRPWALSLLLFVAPLACGETTPDAELRAKIAEGCSINSDCGSPLVCAFRTCHIECQTSRDCERNGPTSRCVQGEKPYRVCQNEKEQKCVRHSECPGQQVCGVDGQCRDACADDRDCGTTQKCVATSCAEPAELGPGGKLTPKPETGAIVSCARSSECPGTLVCLDHACKEECLGDKDCDAGLRCEATRCVLASNGEAGRGGAGGRAGAGGIAGEGGSGGQAGTITTGGRAGNGGAAGVGTAGVAGAAGAVASGAGGAAGDIVKGGDGGSGGLVTSGGNGGDGGSGGTKVDEAGNGGTGGSKAGEGGNAGDDGSGGTNPFKGGSDAGGSDAGGSDGGGGFFGGFGGTGATETCACIDPNDECDANLRCVKKAFKCDAVTSCGTNYSCGADGKCGCTNDQVCGRGCRGGADCPNGLVCFPATERCGLEHTPLRCLGNVSCQTGEGCIDDVCKPLGKKSVGTTCGAHTECESGVCGGVCLQLCKAESDCTGGLRCGPAKSLPNGNNLHRSTQACMAQPPCEVCAAGKLCQYPGGCYDLRCSTSAECPGNVCRLQFSDSECEPFGPICQPNEVLMGGGSCALPKSCYLDEATGCPSGYTCVKNSGGSPFEAPEQGICARKP